jgi:hypothetical protein
MSGAEGKEEKKVESKKSGDLPTVDVDIALLDSSNPISLAKNKGFDRIGHVEKLFDWEKKEITSAGERLNFRVSGKDITNTDLKPEYKVHTDKIEKAYSQEVHGMIERIISEKFVEASLAWIPTSRSEAKPTIELTSDGVLTIKKSMECGVYENPSTIPRQIATLPLHIEMKAAIGRGRKKDDVAYYMMDLKVNSGFVYDLLIGKIKRIKPSTLMDYMGNGLKFVSPIKLPLAMIESYIRNIIYIYDKSFIGVGRHSKAVKLEQCLNNIKKVYDHKGDIDILEFLNYRDSASSLSIREVLQKRSGAGRSHAYENLLKDLQTEAALQAKSSLTSSPKK